MERGAKGRYAVAAAGVAVVVSAVVGRGRGRVAGSGVSGALRNLA